MKRPALTRSAAPRPPTPARATTPRNPVARALAVRAASGAAGRHARASGAARRAERVALQKALVREAPG